MLIARVVTPDLPNRFFFLEKGKHSIGSDPSCSVVLLDQNILEQHFFLYVDEDKFELEVAGSAEVKFSGNARDIPVNIVGGEKLLFEPNARIFLGNICIIFQRFQKETPDYPPLDRKISKMSGKSKVLSLTGSLIGLFFFLNAYLGNEFMGSLQEAFAKRDGEIIPVKDNKTPLSRKKILSFFHSQDIHSVLLAKTSDRWSVSLWVNNIKVKEQLSQKLIDMKWAIDSRFYIDTKIESAVAFALESMSENLSIISVNNGIVKLEAHKHISFENKREIIRMLKGDIAGLKDVTITHRLNMAATELVQMVSAVWLGEFPYVVLKDNSIVQVGEEIKNHMRILEIHEDHILIDSLGEKMKVVIQ